MSSRSVVMAETVTPYRFSVEDYHRMGEVGILGPDDRVELIRGEIVVMPPIGSRHAACVARLNVAFSGLMPRATLSPQNPVGFPDSEPQPDFMLLVPRNDYYASAHPGADDVYLLVEVADTSQRFDREVKGPLYAEQGIREYWLVDVAADRIEVYRRPEGDTWRETRTVGRGETLAPEAFPDHEVAADDLLP